MTNLPHDVMDVERDAYSDVVVVMDGDTPGVVAVVQPLPCCSVVTHALARELSVRAEAGAAVVVVIAVVVVVADDDDARDVSAHSPQWIHGSLRRENRQIDDDIDCSARILSIDTASFSYESSLSYRLNAGCLTSKHMQEHSNPSANVLVDFAGFCVLRAAWKIPRSVETQAPLIVFLIGCRHGKTMTEWD